MTSGSARNPFGMFLVPPDALTHEERVDLLIRAVPELRYGDIGPYTRSWLADSLEAWLRAGGDLEQHLGLRPARGSRRSPPAVYAKRRNDEWLIRLSNAIGSDADTLRVLTGKLDCPTRARLLLADRAMFEIPKSPAAFTRARARLSRHGR